MSENKKRRRRGKTGRTIKKWIKRLILLVILAAAALFGAKAYIRNQAANTEETESYDQARVMRGAMSETVYGTGTTSAKNQPNLLVEADGTLTDLRVSVGDAVKKGDILAVMTNEDIDDTITDLEFKLWDLDAQITDTRSGSKIYKIEAPIAGRIMAVYGKAGDDTLAVFRREGALAIINTDERMRVELTAKEGQLGLALDEKVTVIGDHIYAEGTVIELTRQGTQAVVTIMEEELPVNKDFDGDGRADTILGTLCEVKNSDGDIVGEGELQCNKPMAVSAFGGTITYVDALVGEEVKRGERMFRLEDSPLTLAIENLRLQREAAAKELNNAIEQRENLIIVAPCDGIVASIEVKEGDEITNGTLFGSILEGEDMNLTIAVDELDVVSVEIGQPVEITIDALSSLKLNGEVYKIAPVGTSSGGVTTYDVELTFDAEGTGVRSGMNATGEIEVAAADDVLYVPVEALMTINNKTYVMVADGGSMTLADAAKSAGSQRGGRSQGMPGMGSMPQGGSMPNFGSMPEGMTAPAGESPEKTEAGILDKVKTVANQAVKAVRAWLYEGVEVHSAEQATGSLAEVSVGMRNDDYAEISAGLNEGDVVLYKAAETSSNSLFNMMMGGMGGGMPGGMGGGPR